MTSTKIFKILAFFCLFTTIGTTAFGFDAEDLNKYKEKLKTNKSFDSNESIDEKKQIIYFQVANELWYTIDFRAKLCFAEGKSSIKTVVDCGKLKVGYPDTIGSLISW